MMTLHEEIIAVLRSVGHSLTSTEIAARVNRLQRYQRKDGEPVPASQIRARATKYPNLFVLSGSSIELRARSSVQRGHTSHATEPREVQSADTKLETAQPESITSVADVIAAGFTELGILGDLLSAGLPDFDGLSKCGVYLVTAPEGYKPEFISVEMAHKVGNVINPYNVSRLAEKWVDNVDVIYIGLAGYSRPRSLRKRLSDLLRHGNGQTSESGPHKGGEILWQLRGYESFTVWAMPTGNPPGPRDTEKELIQLFEAQSGRLPFANRLH